MREERRLDSKGREMSDFILSCFLLLTESKRGRERLNAAVSLVPGGEHNDEALLFKLSETKKTNVFTCKGERE